MPYHGVHCMLLTEVLVPLLTYLMMDMHFMFVFPFSKIHPGKQQTAMILYGLMDCLFQTVFLSKSLFLGCGGLTLVHIKAALSLPFSAGQGDTRQPLQSRAKQV